MLRNPASGLLQINHKFEKWQWRHNLPIWRRHQFCCCCCCRFVSAVKFSYWSKFHLNIVTSFDVITIYFSIGLTRNPEIRNIALWVLFNIWRLGWVRDAKFSMNVSNKMLLNAAKWQGHSLYHFWIIKGKPAGKGSVGKITLPLPRLGLKVTLFFSHNFWIWHIRLF